MMNKEKMLKSSLRKIAIKSMKSFGIIGFKNTFSTLYNKVIIPTAIKYAEKKDDEVNKLKEQLREKETYIKELKQRFNLP